MISRRMFTLAGLAALVAGCVKRPPPAPIDGLMQDSMNVRVAPLSSKDLWEGLIS